MGLQARRHRHDLDGVGQTCLGPDQGLDSGLGLRPGAHDLRQPLPVVLGRLGPDVAHRLGLHREGVQVLLAEQVGPEADLA
jgi:hypothetical protein